VKSERNSGSEFVECGLGRIRICSGSCGAKHGEDQRFKLAWVDAATDEELAWCDGNPEVGNRKIAAGVNKDRQAIEAVVDMEPVDEVE
jgi:hypothetical protein